MYELAAPPKGVTVKYKLPAPGFHVIDTVWHAMRAVWLPKEKKKRKKEAILPISARQHGIVARFTFSPYVTRLDEIVFFSPK